MPDGWGLPSSERAAPDTKPEPFSERGRPSRSVGETLILGSVVSNILIPSTSPPLLTVFLLQRLGPHMSSDDSLSPPKPLPWSDHALEHLCETLQATAQSYGFSPRRTDRYEAWILAFLSWSGERVSSDAAAPTVDPSDIGAFRNALRTRTDTTTGEIYEAMDALSFLFGAVARADESLTILPDGVAFEPEEPSRTSHKADASSDGLRTLQIGWHQETTAAVSEATSDAAPRPLETPPDNRAADSRTDDQASSSSASTAETYLQEYQMQLEALHVSDSDADAEAGSESRRDEGAS